MQQRTTISVVLIDDHALFVEGVRALLASAPDVSVVASASSGVEGLALISDIEPTVALIDVSLPDINGLTVVKRLGGLLSPTKFIMLSAHEERPMFRQATKVGASGYVLKRSAFENLLHAIRAVAGGGFYKDPSVAGHSMAHEQSGQRKPGRKDTAPDRPPLSAREGEVLRLIAFGFLTKEIAGQLGVTVKSVETYKARATKKLSLASRAGIVEYAMHRGWLSDDMVQ